MRKPLMAGNWKMNLNHLEAIAVAQKLVYSLDDKDYDAVDVAILPPFTDIRSIQTMVDGDRLRLQYGAQDLSPDAMARPMSMQDLNSTMTVNMTALSPSLALEQHLKS